jgi:hypothetical protein
LTARQLWIVSNEDRQISKNWDFTDLKMAWFHQQRRLDFTNKDGVDLAIGGE